MLKYVLPALICFGLFSCSEASTDAQIKHLDKQKMTEVLRDLALMEAAVTIKIAPDPSQPIDSTLRFNIYRQHNITKGMYDSSLSYYSNHPQEFKEIYEKVLEQLQQMKSK
ncbi:MAG: hypothetical protein K0S33_2060 [Bacteroidetes bacterium]|jgi:hypothetical protein|nr:hypothetical protein [Bacteroidota bacterium]